MTGPLAPYRARLRHMPVISDPVAYWDHYADGVATETVTEALKNASAGRSTKARALVRNCSANPSPRWSSGVAAVT
jgi:hypothetical protein